MKTIDELRARCVVDPDTGCWEMPPEKPESACVWVFDYNYGMMKNMLPRRAAWMLTYAEPVTAGYRVFSKCGNKRCCCPDHMVERTVREQGARVRKTGELRGKVRRILANRATSRQRTKLTPEVMREIEASNELGYVLAARLGISPTTVSKARKALAGEVFLASRRATPWDGLMRRSA